MTPDEAFASMMTPDEEFAAMPSDDTLRSLPSRHATWIRATVKPGDGLQGPIPGGHYTAMDIDGLQGLMLSVESEVESEQAFIKRTREIQQRRVSKLLDFCKQQLYQDRASSIVQSQ
jgi:hypothetical protein